MSWLSDLQADIASGRVRTCSADEHLHRWQEFCSRNEELFHNAAGAIAAQFGFDVDALRHEAERRAAAIYGTRDAAQYPLFRRALAIARERQARAA